MDFIGDAFQADHDARKKDYGVQITSPEFQFKINGNNNTIDSVTPEEERYCIVKENDSITNRSARRTLAISNDLFVAYSVRGKHIRVLSVVTGQKLLMKGHTSTIVEA